MIYIGVTGWGDHDSIYSDNVKSKDKLGEYGSHFPVVEVDAAFYAIQPIRNAENWVKQTPDDFRFVVKAYQGMTGHQRGEIPFDSKKDMFHAFHASLQPYLEAGKLAMVLFQFPPWFDCTKENVTYLRYCKKMMGDVPASLEFRNQTWFSEQFKSETLQFMREEGWIHSVVDAPQAGQGSVPIVPEATHPESTLIRMHGRNVHGWNKSGNANWREVRYLYNYNEQELKEWKGLVEQHSSDVFVLFNNNSGGDAANNAKQFQEMLGIEYEGLSPRQLDLF